MNDEERSALDAVTNFLGSYAKRDVEGCISHMASEPGLVFGTNDNEVFTTRDELRTAFTRDFSSMSDIRWGELRHTHVISTPTLASVLFELSLSFRSDGKDVETLFRYALTLVMEEGRWKIRSGMASVPFASGTYTFSG